MGRTKDIIVLPSGLNVYPEDVENALRTAGLRESVVVETRPGRIEAVVLGPRGTSEGATEAGAGPNDAAAESPEGDLPAVATEPLQAAVRAANATLAPHQRVAAIRIWYEDDFPRTNTLKVRRDIVRRWAVDHEPLPVREGDGHDGD
jgi:long-chain acyl-CoA synthetase